MRSSMDTADTERLHPARDTGLSVSPSLTKEAGHTDAGLQRQNFAFTVSLILLKGAGHTDAEAQRQYPAFLVSPGRIEGEGREKRGKRLPRPWPRKPRLLSP